MDGLPGAASPREINSLHLIEISDQKANAIAFYGRGQPTSDCSIGPLAAPDQTVQRISISIEWGSQTHYAIIEELLKLITKLMLSYLVDLLSFDVTQIHTKISSMKNGRAPPRPFGSSRTRERATANLK